MTKHFKTSDPPAEKPNSPPIQPVAEPPAPLEPRPEPQEAAPAPAAPEPAEQPPEVVTAPETETEPAAPRRSARASQPTDKLQLSWGTKSYVQTVSVKVPSSFGIKDSSLAVNLEGEEGITEIPALSTD